MSTRRPNARVALGSSISCTSATVFDALVTLLRALDGPQPVRRGLPHTLRRTRLLSVTCRRGRFAERRRCARARAMRHACRRYRRGSSVVRLRGPPRALCHTLRRRRPVAPDRDFRSPGPRRRRSGCATRESSCAALALGPLLSNARCFFCSLSFPTSLSANTPQTPTTVRLDESHLFHCCILFAAKEALTPRALGKHAR